MEAKWIAKINVHKHRHYILYCTSYGSKVRVDVKGIEVSVQTIQGGLGGEGFMAEAGIGGTFRSCNCRLCACKKR